MKAKMLGLLVAAMAMAPTISHSIPTTYFASSPLIASGTFTIDVGLPLGDYFATNVSGDGGTQVSLWTGVEFRAELDTDPDLLFTGINPSTGTTLFGFADYIGIPIGGFNILPGSTASAEWANLLAGGLLASGLVVTPVPEPGTLALLAVAIGLLTLGRHRMTRGDARRRAVHRPRSDLQEPTVSI